MAKDRLTPQDLDARLKFILGITLGSILFLTSVGIMYALIFVTHPILIPICQFSHIFGGRILENHGLFRLYEIQP